MLSLLAAIGALPLALGAPVTERQDANKIPGQYIVVMKESVSGPGIFSSPPMANIQKQHEYNIGSFKGFAAELDDQQVANLEAHPEVAYIEQDGIAHAVETVTQNNAPWGLGRISHRQKGSTQYVYDNSNGNGVCAYIVDTGIYAEHSEFGGRATFLRDFSGTGATTDDNGHGTHCAGTIGSNAYGVAKAAKLYGIKVLDAGGSGSWSNVIAGINYAVQDSRTRSCPNGIVVNMSLGGSYQQAVNDAVANAINSGLFFGVAAGNDGQDYRNTSPASTSTACTVGASDINDNMASFSNYGSGLCTFGPGVNVLSTWIGGSTSTNSISGTSMATPHIVGLGAYILGLEGPMSPAQLKSRIMSLATTGAISLTSAARNSPNRLAFNGAT